jgi:hypothetical protein
MFSKNNMLQMNSNDIYTDDDKYDKQNEIIHY